MTQRCAQIINGIVENIVIADPSAFNPGDGSLIVASDTAQIGWTYSSGAFAATTAPPQYQITGLTFLQFFGLFTNAERAAIVNASDTQTRLFVLMASGAGEVDLGNTEVINGVNYLASIGLITSARASTILTGAPPA
ncbi:MAG: hypothetical protein KGM15_11315 [Pseudomonadota bacterium]|nr:hypothetical protein [Pseudomonadota bacterium]